jgi:hypothetical protein
MADILTLKLWLAEAEIARHQMAQGKQKTMASAAMDGGGNSAQWAAASPEALDRHIANLKNEIAVAEGGPVRQAFYFGG